MGLFLNEGVHIAVSQGKLLITSRHDKKTGIDHGYDAAEAFGLV
jgi:hypothetical protein